MNAIANLNIYNDSMRKSMVDKLFFLDHIPTTDVDTIVDYGCADGTLLAMVDNGWNKIGVDMNLDMLTRAEQMCEGGEFILANNLPVLDGRKKVLNLASVLHEIYSYGTKDDVFTFWKNLFNSDYEYIVIRDLITDVDESEKSDKDDVNAIKNSKWGYLVESFENKWGSLEKRKNLLHFLLKYRYTENWDREVNENYFNLSVNELLNLIPGGYEVVYKRTYCLPFVHDRIKNDLNIDVKNTTHIQLILKKRVDK